MGELSNLEVETGIVDKDHDVGVESEDVFFAEADVAHHSAEMRHHLYDAHDGKVADMADHGAGVTSSLFHAVATPITETGFLVLQTQSPD